MNRFPKLAAIFLSAAMFFTNAVQAMEITKFDKMAIDDQSDYINVLVDGAQKVLISEGRSDLAIQVHKLFSDVHSGDTMPLGMIAFEENLDHARLFDAQRAAKDPNARRLEVEDAMAVTLKKNGIMLPQQFFTVASNFTPKHGPQNTLTADVRAPDHPPPQ
jgi:hypothetical protein